MTNFVNHTENFVKSLVKNICIQSKRVSRHQRSNVFEITQTYASGEYLFQMSRFLILAEKSCRIVFESPWSLLSNGHNLQLPQLESDFNHVINKLFPNILSGRSTASSVNKSELRTCLAEITTNPWSISPRNDQDLSSAAISAIEYIQNNLFEIICETTPSFRNASFNKVKLVLNDDTYIRVDTPYYINGFGELTIQKQPEVAYMLNKDDHQVSFITGEHERKLVPNKKFSEQIIIEAFNWICEHRYDWLLQAPNGTPIMKSEIITKCIRGNI